LKHSSKTITILNYKDSDVEAVSGSMKLKIRCKFRLSFIGIFYKNKIYENDWHVVYKYEEKSRKLEFGEADIG
jgi:hypothetical protein